MRRFFERLCSVLAGTLTLAGGSFARNALTWQEIRDKFEAANPSLRAGQIGVEESHAQEITAYLRPNPNLTLSMDGTQIAPYQGVWRPLSGSAPSSNVSYLHERQRKRELRLESAQNATKIAVLGPSDLERALVSSLRWAFMQTLQQKAVLKLAEENLSYYNHHVLDVNRERFRGTIAFSYEHGAASLLDFLNAQAQYRSVQLSYLNLVGSYLEGANQLNLAVGREVNQ